MNATPRRILIIGATSAIAQAAARLWAERGATLFLVGRKEVSLQAIQADLQVRFGAASLAGVHVTDLNEMEGHQPMIDAAVAAFEGAIDIALIAHGVLPDQQRCQDDPKEALATVRTNALSVLSVAGLLANLLERQRRGSLVVITSVAADRGRRSNYVYGAAKAMVATFLQGLQHRLAPLGAHVLDIRPGFVDTPMTASFKKNGPLWVQPEQVARIIVRSAERRSRSVVYAPARWYWIMLLVRAIPERLFRRINL